jgi:hypothetical protein
MPDIEAAETTLQQLERHRHASATARRALQTAEFSGDKGKIAAAKDALTAAETAEKADGASPQDIDYAAQAVLDARGEVHTETSVLPESLGAPVMAARRTLSHARQEGTPKDVADADAALKAALAANTDARENHARQGLDRHFAEQKAAADAN